MSKVKKIAITAGLAVVTTAIIVKVMEKKAAKTAYKTDMIDPIPVRNMGFYEKYVKRILDVACAASALVVFSPLYIGIAIVVKVKLGSPIIFAQDRPGLIDSDGKETIFKMYKFRTMTDVRDENGNLLPDEQRMTKIGECLRKFSLDELPEAFNILNGTMSVVGPRPQLVRDLVFMNKEQRRRHTAKPGLSGLAQINGRNAITWEKKLDWDQKYIKNVNFVGDLKIIFNTIKKALIKQEGITEENMATAQDYGDYLLNIGKIDQNKYNQNQEFANELLDKTKK